MKKSTQTDQTKLFLQLLAPAMSEPKVIKAVLKLASKQGLNPKTLYSFALKTRPKDFAPAPPESEIFPL